MTILQPNTGRREGGAESSQSIRRGSWPVLAALLALCLILGGCIKADPKTHFPPAPPEVKR